MKTQSAGGVVLACKNADTYVALVRHADGMWVLPKGHFETREDATHAAIREVHEETGLPEEILEIVSYLGKFEFNEFDPKNHSFKENHFFLMRLRQASELPQLKSDPAHTEAAWHRLPLNAVQLRYEYQRILLARVTADLALARSATAPQ
jgi:8-oxo-dGTP pyrophosphatase MutT (NUDIX family)